jgi:hypothetical protein
VLVAFGRRFDELAAKLDDGLDIAWEMLEEFSQIEGQVIARPATMIEGLWVKARVTCWARLGDLDASEQSKASGRMALSMMRDLIRLHDPSLERPGALKRLVNEIKQKGQARRQYRDTLEAGCAAARGARARPKSDEFAE